ncbi:hypothetical protein DFS34DRAFT_89837 [Phlyctochytrium arcticum]|nr:hypothetical protein DFS34DRAFT_89837 [Phlyctochytrium arcticum]
MTGQLTVPLFVPQPDGTVQKCYAVVDTHTLLKEAVNALQNDEILGLNELIVHLVERENQKRREGVQYSEQRQENFSRHQHQQLGVAPPPLLPQSGSHAQNHHIHQQTPSHPQPLYHSLPQQQQPQPQPQQEQQQQLADYNTLQSTSVAHPPQSIPTYPSAPANPPINEPVDSVPDFGWNHSSPPVPPTTTPIKTQDTDTDPEVPVPVSEEQQYRDDPTPKPSSSSSSSITPSARHRLKKKLHVQSLERAAREMSDRVRDLQQSAEGMESEISFLRDLIRERDGKEGLDRQYWENGLVFIK